MTGILLVMFLFLTNFVFAQKGQFVYDDHGKRDPFWKLVSPSGAIVTYETDLLFSDISLEGIIYDPSGKSLAIINGAILKPNDRIGPFLVSKIENKKVILLKGQESFTLYLKKEE